MTHLGDFGTPREQVDITFGLFGSVMRVNPSLSDVAVIELFADLEGVGLSAGPGEIMAALRRIIVAVVSPDDLDDFWTVARANRIGVEDIQDIAMKILEAATDRPTERPSDSSAGPSSTDTSSEDGSSSLAPVIASLPPGLAADVIRLSEARKAG